ncbi:MAG: hypothetical protein AAGA90_08715 [Actinomycetota bacterium]
MIGRARRAGVALAVVLSLAAASCGIDDGARVRMQDNVKGSDSSSSTTSGS